MIPPPLAFAAFLAASLLLFRLLPVRVSLLAIIFGGWGLLPNASYASSDSVFPYWILGASLPSDYLLTKASVIGAAVLLCLLLFERPALLRFRLSPWDVPMLLWCVVPLLSGIANPDMALAGLLGSLYIALAWGLPYLAGRLFFSDSRSLSLVVRAILLAGLLYVPVCLVEIAAGPRLYHLVYGYLPFQWTGARRYVGFRPVGFLESGNQLGMWMCTSALLAIWAWHRGVMRRIGGLPVGLAALLLTATALLCQSTGSILLLAGMLPFVFLSRRHAPRAMALALIAGILMFAGLRLANFYSLRGLLAHNRAAQSANAFLQHIGRGSLAWRLAQDERFTRIALEHPVLGFGDWQWWRLEAGRPWGLWLLSFGMYGAAGLIALEVLLLLPVIRVAWFPLARADVEEFRLRFALSAAVLMSAVDSLLNPAVLLPLLLIVGGMTGWRSASSEVRVEVEAPRRAGMLAAR